MENIFLITLISLIAGVIGFVVSKLFLSRNIQTLATEKAVLDKELNLVRTDLSGAREALQKEAQKVERFNTELSERNTQKETLQAQMEELTSHLGEEQLKVEQKTKETQKLEREKASLEAELKFANEKLDKQKQEIENIGNKFENQFKVLAGQILEEKKNAFSKDQEISLKAILDPLKENISTFKNEFETKYKTESHDRISLREQVIQMMRLNQTLSDQANNLTQALRGQVKQQGNWGEMILESILAYSGLQKNLQYFVQERSNNAEGTIIQPDILVKYPDSRNIIVDSKVSLLHYERFATAETPDEQKTHLNLLVRSFKSHIDGLSAKDYQDINGTFDFVMMFVPVEAAYITAMQTDPELWQYAYKKRVLLISPTNLIAAMKLVNDMWQKDAINQNAKAIADRAAKVYDKLVLFVTEFEKVGTHLDKAVHAHTEVKKKLHTGRGNLISQAEQMKQLKIVTKNELPVALAEQALIEDGIDLDQVGTEELKSTANTDMPHLN